MDQDEYLAYKELREYLNEISGFSLLTLDQELELGRRKDEGGNVEARNSLVNANLRFVHRVGKNYFKLVDHPLEILFAGNGGLITAADNFDYKKGKKLVAYAGWEIRRAMFDYLAETIDFAKLPSGQIRLRILVSRVINDWERDYGCIPSPEEIRTCLKERYKLGRSISSISRVMVSTGGESLSLDWRSRGGASLGDMLSNCDWSDITGALENESVGQVLSEVLGGLGQMERNIFLMHAMDGMFFKEIGKVFGMTRQGATRIYNIARSRIRKRLNLNPAFRELGMDYLFKE